MSQREWCHDNGGAEASVPEPGRCHDKVGAEASVPEPDRCHDTIPASQGVTPPQCCHDNGGAEPSVPEPDWCHDTIPAEEEIPDQDVPSDPVTSAPAEPDEYRWLNAEMRALVAYSDARAAARAGGPPVRVWRLRNEERLGYWLACAYHACNALARDGLQPLGITPAQASMLLDIRESGGMWWQGYYARRQRVTRAVVTRTLQRMADAGLVALVSDGGQHPRQWPELTAAGAVLVEQVEERLSAIGRLVREHLGAEERRWLMQALPRLESAARRARNGR